MDEKNGNQGHIHALFIEKKAHMGHCTQKHSTGHYENLYLKKTLIKLASYIKYLNT